MRPPMRAASRRWSGAVDIQAAYPGISDDLARLIAVSRPRYDPAFASTPGGLTSARSRIAF
jgi:hypothetical protein